MVSPEDRDGRIEIAELISGFDPIEEKILNAVDSAIIEGEVVTVHQNTYIIEANGIRRFGKTKVQRLESTEWSVNF